MMNHQPTNSQTNAESGPHVVLVNMPWMPVDVPSLALGILTRAVHDGVPGARVTVRHANLDFVDWIVERYAFTVHDYRYYATATYFQGLGDWVFSSALYDDPNWHNDEFDREFADKMTDDELAMNHDLHALAPQFVRELAEEIVAAGPDVVGFTSTYQQTVAGLAVARHIKRLAPQTVVVFGGANCDGEQGLALHRNFDWVDFVVRGEGEAVFPELLRTLRCGADLSSQTGQIAVSSQTGQTDMSSQTGQTVPTDLSSLPGLVRRAPDGRGSIAAPISAAPLAPAAIVSPDYEGYFERLAESEAGSWVQPMLVVEGARGCWWGEKHHCTFCGLNGSTMQFRSKSPARFHDEIIELVARHQVLDMFVVDNILDMGYLTSLLPRIAEDGYDLRLQYEIKSNMRRDQLEILARAGLVSVQPGIENLDSAVLRIMDKGVTGAQNVKMLRDSSSCHLSVLWNYLYGFPGETDAHYTGMIAQFPALHHLQPPGGATRIVVERFSPYFKDPELGFPRLRSAKQYGLVYDLPDEELYDMAYLFDSDPQGIGGQVEKDLNDAVARWEQAHLTSALTVCDLGDALVLANRREQFPWETLRLTDPLEVAAFRLLEHPRTVTGLTRALAEAGLGAADETGTADEIGETDEANQPDEATVAALILRWTDLGLLFHDGVRIVHVAVDAANQDVHRLDERRLFVDRQVSELVDELVGVEA